MPPERTKNKRRNAEGGSSKPERKPHPAHQVKTNALPGRQKIKGALRQARRLLAKEGLAANVRVETERRVKALEAELEQTEVAHKERDLAVRYHKVKFFERQKVVRKLNQTKKALELAKDSGKKKLEEELLNHRVNLNYILHYPKTRKYISLFPPEVRKGAPEPSGPEAVTTSQDREEIRTWVRECMKKNELPADPELHLESEKPSIKTLPPSSAKFQSRTTTATKGEASKDHQKDTKHAGDIGEDDFFGNDDASSSESDKD